ncbi:dihydroneopterin aldolase [Cnuibacter sp. UC19_7]|uniref:dihydroneopterin aldolase n=1 Tax=Cnuibacter sp. UC19_7 TaxID=3350166 RepID=UPI00366DE6B5
MSTTRADPAEHDPAQHAPAEHAPAEHAPAERDAAGPLDELTLTGLEVFAHHGYYAFEREQGQRFVIDTTLWLDTRAAATGDDLDRTVHYGVLAEQIASAAQSDPVDLIETLAERVAGVVLAYPTVARTRVTVHKPDAPIEVPFADVSITITRTQGAASTVQEAAGA